MVPRNGRSCGDGRHICTFSRDVARRARPTIPVLGRESRVRDARQQQQQQQQQQGVVDGAGVVGSSAGSLYGSGNMRGEVVVFALAMGGFSICVYIVEFVVSFQAEGGNS